MIQLSDKEWKQFLQMKPNELISSLEVLMANSRQSQEAILKGISKMSQCFPNLKKIMIDLRKNNLEGGFLTALTRSLEKLSKLESITARLQENDFSFTQVAKFMSSKLFKDSSNIFKIKIKENSIYLEREQILLSFDLADNYSIFVKVSDQSKHAYFEHFVSIDSENQKELALIKGHLIQRICKEASISKIKMEAKGIQFSLEGTQKPQQIINFQFKEPQDFLKFKTLEDFGLVYLNANTQGEVNFVKEFHLKSLTSNRKIFMITNLNRSGVFILSLKSKNCQIRYEADEVEDDSLNKIISSSEKIDGITNYIFQAFQQGLNLISISNLFEFQIFLECILPKLSLDTFKIMINLNSNELFSVEQNKRVPSSLFRYTLTISCSSLSYAIKCLKGIGQIIQFAYLNNIQQSQYDYQDNVDILSLGIYFPQCLIDSFQSLQNLISQIEKLDIIKIIERCYLFYNDEKDLKEQLFSCPFICEMKRLRILSIQTFDIHSLIFALLSNQGFIPAIPNQNLLQMQLMSLNNYIYKIDWQLIKQLKQSCFDSVTSIQFSNEEFQNEVMKQLFKCQNLVSSSYIYVRNEFEYSIGECGGYDPSDYDFDCGPYDKVDYHDNPFCSRTRKEMCTCNNDQYQYLRRSWNQWKKRMFFN